MKKQTMFYGALVLFIGGITLIGWWLGRILNYSCEGFIIVIDLGLGGSVLVLLKVLRWRDALKKVVILNKIK